MELPQSVVRKGLGKSFHYGLTPVHSEACALRSNQRCRLSDSSQPHQLALFTQVDHEIEGRLEKLANQIRFDALYMTRQQRERMKDGDVGDADYPRLGEEFLRERRLQDTLVMHPLPRVDELAPEIDRDRRDLFQAGRVRGSGPHGPA
jgi:aspartate carbamoyltransferase catalytic subunit